MATVPVYQQSTPLDVSNTARDTSQASPNDFGAAIADGLTSVAKGTFNVADALQTVNAVTAKADATAATTNYMNLRRSILSDPTTGYLSQSGSNALGDAPNAATSKMAAAREQIVAGLSPAAAKEFNLQADALDNNAQNQIIDHQGTQLKSYLTTTQKSSVEASLQEAGASFNDSATSDAFLQKAVGDIHQMAALNGWPPETTQAAVLKATSTVFAQRTENMAFTDPVAANDFLQANKTQMDPQTFLKLEGTLKTPMEIAKATTAVNMAIAKTSTTGTDQYGVPFWLLNPESSGGTTQAKNPNSSASGRGQMLDSTFLQSVREAQAAGGATWATGLSDADVLAAKMDPAKEADAIKQNIADNQRILKDSGYAVRPSTQYAMWHFGAAGGPALLKAVSDSPDAPVETILGANVVAANPWMTGMTANQTFAAIARMSGDPAPSTTGPDLMQPTAATGAVPNPAGALDEVLKISDPLVQARALSELSQRMSIGKQVEATNRESLMNTAYTGVLSGQDPMQLPLSTQASIGFAGMDALRAAYKAKVTGVDVNNPLAFQRLFDLSLSTSGSDREAFADMNLNDYAGQLSQQSLTALKVDQAKIRNSLKAASAPGGQPSDSVYKPADYASVASAAKEQFIAATGIDPAKMTNTPAQALEWTHFMTNVKTRMDTYANANGLAMPQSLIDRNIQALLTPVQIGSGGWFSSPAKSILSEAPYRAQGDKVTLHETPDQIPYADRTRIATGLAKAWGRTATEQEVVDQHQREVLYGAGLRPELQYNEIPRDVRTTLETKYPDASPQQRIDLYLSVMAKATQ